MLPEEFRAYPSKLTKYNFLSKVCKSSASDAYIKSHFARIPQEKWFKAIYQYSWVFTARTKWLETQPFKGLKDAFLTMIYIQTAQTHQENPKMDLRESYMETMKQFTPDDEKYGQAPGNSFYEDFLIYSDEISQNLIGTEVLGFEGSPYSDLGIMKKINTLGSDALCTPEGRIISKKKFIKLVRSLLTSDDKMTEAN